MQAPSPPPPAPTTGGAPSAAPSPSASPSTLAPTEALDPPDNVLDDATSNPVSSGSPLKESPKLICPPPTALPLAFAWVLPVDAAVTALPIPGHIVAQMADVFTGTPHWGVKPPWLEISIAGIGGAATWVASFSTQPRSASSTPSQQFNCLCAAQNTQNNSIRLTQGSAVSLRYLGWRPNAAGVNGSQPLYCFELFSSAGMHSGDKTGLLKSNLATAGPTPLHAAARTHPQDPIAREARRARLKALRASPKVFLPSQTPAAPHLETPAVQRPTLPSAATPPNPLASVLEAVFKNIIRAETALLRRRGASSAPSRAPLLHATAAAEVAAGVALETSPGSNVFFSPAAALPPGFLFSERCHWAGTVIPPMNTANIAALGRLGVSPPLLDLLSQRKMPFRLWIGPFEPQKEDNMEIEGETGGGEGSEEQQQKLCVVALDHIPAGSWVLRWAGEYMHHPAAAASGASVEVPLTAATTPAQMSTLQSAAPGSDPMWRRVMGMGLSLRRMGNAGKFMGRWAGAPLGATDLILPNGPPGVFAYSKRDVLAGEVLGLDPGNQLSL